MHNITSNPMMERSESSGNDREFNLNVKGNATGNIAENMTITENTINYGLSLSAIKSCFKSMIWGVIFLILFVFIIVVGVYCAAKVIIDTSDVAEVATECMVGLTLDDTIIEVWRFVFDPSILLSIALTIVIFVTISSVIWVYELQDFIKTYKLRILYLSGTCLVIVSVF